MPERATTILEPSVSSSGLILDISETLLTTIRDAARVSTVPFFQEAIELALGILKVIQGTRDNKDGFKELAADVCALVYVIIRVSEEKKCLSTQDLENVKDLLVTLSSIERFSRKEISQPLVLRVIRHRSDVGKIKRYRETLKHSLDVFGLKSSLSIQETITRMAERQDELMAVLQESPRMKERDGRLDESRCPSNSVVECGGTEGVVGIGIVDDEAAERDRRQEDEAKGAETEGAETERIPERDNMEHHRAELEVLVKQKADETKKRAEVLEREAQEKARVEHERFEKLRLETEQLEREKERTEWQRRDEEREKNRIPTYEQEPAKAAAEDQVAQSGHYNSTWGVESCYVPPFKVAYSPKNPFLQLQRPASPIIHANNASFTSVGGNQVKTDSSHHTTNSNSGNTTTTTITDSNNDFSRTHYQHPRRNRTT